MAVPQGDALRVIRLRRRGMSVSVTGTSHLPLKADIAADAPDVVARGLRDQLREQGIRERKWLLAVPPAWLLSRQIVIPALPPEDEESFLWLQLEQGMPITPDEAVLAVSRYALPQDRQGATLFAMGKARLAHITRVFGAAGLDLIGAAPGVLRAERNASGVGVVLSLQSDEALLQVTFDGSLVILRSLNTIDPGSGESSSELRLPVRLALAGLPDDLRGDVTEMDLVDGPRDHTRLVTEWNGALADAAGDVPRMTQANDANDDPRLTPGAAAAMSLRDGALGFFAPRREPVRVSSVRVRLVRAAVLLVMISLGCAVFVSVQLRREATLKRKLAVLAPTVAKVTDAHEQVTSLAPWFDRMPNSLALLRLVAESFPEQGTVWVNRLTVADGTAVRLDGHATDSKAWLAMQETMRKSPNIGDFRVVQTRAGTAKSRAMAFAVSFTWLEGVRP